MKKTLAERAGYLGAGIGLTAFAIYGLMPGAFLGGLMGLSMAAKLGAMASVISKLTLAVGMLTGVMASGALFLVAGGAAGWLLGRAAEVATGNALNQGSDKVYITR